MVTHRAPVRPAPERPTPGPPRHQGASGPADGRRRRLAFLTTRPSGWSLVVPAVAVIAGILFAMSGATASGNALRGSASDVPDLIRQGTRENAADTQRIDGLQGEIDRLTALKAHSEGQVGQLRAKGDVLLADAGLTKVRGPMVQVSLADSPLRASEIPPGYTVDDVVVHQQDVQAVVNALWAAGAEAMMLMDQRVVSTSAVRCVGNTLILKGRVYSPPFVVRAIGDPVALQAGLEADPTILIYRQYVARLGLGYEVHTESEATFPAFSGLITPAFATGVE